MDISGNARRCAYEDGRKYRKMRGMTQMELARECGLSDSAVRNYELGNRKPSGAHLEMIAEALEVAPEALLEIEANSARMALEYLFRIDEELGLRPERDEEGGVILSVDPSSPKSPKLSAALEAWMRQREMLDAGDISQTEYDAWRIGSGSLDL